MNNQSLKTGTREKGSRSVSEDIYFFSKQLRNICIKSFKEENGITLSQGEADRALMNMAGVGRALLKEIANG